eukprot:PhM_4_TR14077/c8_g1_i1/m.60785
MSSSSTTPFSPDSVLSRARQTMESYERLVAQSNLNNDDDVHPNNTSPPPAAASSTYSTSPPRTQQQADQKPASLEDTTTALSSSSSSSLFRYQSVLNRTTSPPSSMSNSSPAVVDPSAAKATTTTSVASTINMVGGMDLSGIVAERDLARQEASGLKLRLQEERDARRTERERFALEKESLTAQLEKLYKSLEESNRERQREAKERIGLINSLDTAKEENFRLRTDMNKLLESRMEHLRQPRVSVEQYKELLAVTEHYAKLLQGAGIDGASFSPGADAVNKREETPPTDNNNNNNN